MSTENFNNPSKKSLQFPRRPSWIHNSKTNFNKSESFLQDLNSTCIESLNESLNDSNNFLDNSNFFNFKKRLKLKSKRKKHDLKRKIKNKLHIITFLDEDLSDFENEKDLNCNSNRKFQKNVDTIIEDKILEGLYEESENSNTEYIEYRTNICLLYTSPSPRDGLLSRMPSSA